MLGTMEIQHLEWHQIDNKKQIRYEVKVQSVKHTLTHIHFTPTPTKIYSHYNNECGARKRKNSKNL